MSKRPIEERAVDPSCPWWILGNEKSADKDLKSKFEIVDEKDNRNEKYEKKEKEIGITFN